VPAVIENNVFVSCGNSGISNYVDPGRMAIERNVFFATPRDVIEHHAGGSLGEIKEKNLEELEDLGFKACAGNAVQDPAITGIPGTWSMRTAADLFARLTGRRARRRQRASRRRGSSAAHARRRREAGSEGRPRAALSGQCDRDLHRGRQGRVSRDRAPVSLTPRAPAPTPDYRRIEFRRWHAGYGARQRARRAARRTRRIAEHQPARRRYLRDAHGSSRLQPGSDDESFYVLIPRNSFPSRQYNESRKLSARHGGREDVLGARSLPHDTVNTRQKSHDDRGVDSRPRRRSRLRFRRVPKAATGSCALGLPAATAAARSRSAIRSRRLEKAEGGDTIHVAAGDYFGKLRSGKWLLTIRYLALLGGYDAEFKTRDPWTNLTRFALDAEEKAKGRPSGKILYSEENSDVFCSTASSSTARPGTPTRMARSISTTRRRAVDPAARHRFSGDGAQLSLPQRLRFGRRSQLHAPRVENNVIVNTNGDALVVSVNAAGPAVIRNNTLLFASDPTERAGTGQSSSRGTVMQLKGRGTFELESNVIGSRTTTAFAPRCRRTMSH